MPVGARALARTLALAGALASTACSGWKPPDWYAPHPCERPDMNGCVIGKVAVVGAKQVKEGDVKEKLATAETSHSLGGALENVPILSIWDRITVDYEKLDPFVLERDLERVERLYRARGYYEAHAKAARVRKVGKERVRVEIVVEEGEPVKVSRARIVYKDGAQPDKRVRDAIKTAMEALPAGEPFAEAPFEDLKQKIVRAMTDRGYAYGKVEAHAEVDLVAHTADVTYTAEPGPPTVFGKVTIEGQGDLPTDRLLHVIDIVPGKTFSTARLDKAQLALGDLRVFSSVEAVPQLAKEGETPAKEVPIVFRVTPTTLKTVKMGGGAELGTRVDVHGVASWENRNFLGGLRVFSVEGKPGLVFPLSAGQLFAGQVEKAKTPILEVRLHAALTQPGFIESQMRGIVSVDANMLQAPLLPDTTRGYLEFAGKTGVERPLWDGRVRLGLFFNASVDVPLELNFQKFGLVSCGNAFPTLAIPYVQSTFALDLRRDAEGKRNALLPAHSGFYLTNDVQLAVGGAARDVRIRPEARGYIPIGKRVTLALKLGGGFLYPFGGDLTLKTYPEYPYGNDAQLDKTTGCPALPPGEKSLPADETFRTRWIQVLQLRGFSSGGTNSNRGYAYGAIGPQEIVPGASPIANDGKTQLPLATGGRALWEASVELRFPIYDKLGMTLFLDGSDVRQAPSDFANGFAPHLSTGLGIRYETPVGPLRADIGLRIPGAQVFGSSTRCAVYDPSRRPREDQLWLGPGFPLPTAPDGCFIVPDYGQAGSIGGVPLAISLAIGEAF
jgi:outer membrane protein insertion porin family/translocation and assembly module TamA